MDPIQVLENQYLHMRLFCDGSASILDKRSGVAWKMGAVALQEEGFLDEGHVWMRHRRSICEQYPGRFEVSPEARGLRYTLFGRQHQRKGSFLCEVVLEEACLVFRLLEIDEDLKSLAFPPPIQSESLVLPVGEGIWVRKPLRDRFFWLTFCDAYKMRWLGGLNRENGWIAILDEGCADSGIMAAELSAYPAWMKSLGSWQGIKSVRYMFSSQGGYVSLAKIFRNWAKEKGMHRSLAEKMQACPAARNLHGSRSVYFREAKASLRMDQLEDALTPVSEQMRESIGRVHVNFNHRETLELIRQLPSLGVDKALIQVGGWLNDGYDGRYPDVWPPEPSLGSADELKNILAEGDPFTVGLHDNYQDMYEHSPSFPEGVVIRKNGSFLAGGMWDLRQAYIINSRDSLQYQIRNWKKIKTLEPRFIYIDTVLASQLYESYEPGNTLTRSQDLALKIHLLKFYKDKGVVLGTETGADYGMYYVDWLAANHSHTVGTTIPLWSLVYHDAVFCGCDTSSLLPFNTNGIENPWWLKFLVWGYMLHIWIDGKEDWENHKAYMGSTNFVDKWHQKIGSDEMLLHRYLTEDGMVEETVFSSGRSIVANFGKEERQLENYSLGGGAYRIKE